MHLTETSFRELFGWTVTDKNHEEMGFKLQKYLYLVCVIVQDFSTQLYTYPKQYSSTYLT